MKLNKFGEPRPATFDEVSQALDMMGLIFDECQAEIFDSREEEAPFTGWTAEISNAETGEQRFQTCGFPDKEVFIAGLESIGISLIVDMT